MTKRPNRQQNRRQSEYALVALAHTTTILPYRLAANLERAGRLAITKSGFYSSKLEATRKLENNS